MFEYLTACDNEGYDCYYIHHTDDNGKVLARISKVDDLYWAEVIVEALTKKFQEEKE